MIKDTEATDCSISFSVTPVQARALNLPWLLIDSYKICRKPKIDSYKIHILLKLCIVEQVLKLALLLLS